MANDLETTTSRGNGRGREAGEWLRLGLIAAGSALAGGLAAAWWYRKTLSKLHQAAEDVPHYRTNIQEDENPEDV